MAILFQLMEHDDLNIIMYHGASEILQWSSGSESKPLYKLFLYVNKSLKYLLVTGFIDDIIPGGMHRGSWWQRAASNPIPKMKARLREGDLHRVDVWGRMDTL